MARSSDDSGPGPNTFWSRLAVIFNEDHIVAFGRWVIRWRWAIIALSLLAAVIAASGGRFLGFSSDYRVFFSDDNPQLAAFEAMQRVYTKDDNISIVIKPAKGDVFTPEMLTSIRELTTAAWKTPFASRVDSLTNFQYSYAEGDDLTVRDLVPKSASLTADNIAAIRTAAFDEPLLLDRIISPDGTTTNVNITLILPQKDETEIPSAMAYARELTAKFEADHPSTRVGITGLVALNSAFFETSMRDMNTLFPIMYGVLLLTMVLLLRSFSGTVATLLVIGLSALTAMGLTGWLGIRLTPPSSVAPTVILTIAIADSIHILVTMLKAMRQGMDKRAAIVESLRVNFGPVFLTSLTTVIGFLSLNFSDSPPFGDLGNITAMGVIAAWLYSILFLPALMAVLPLRVKARPEHQGAFLNRFADFVIARRTSLLMGTTLLVVGLGAIMVPRIELNDQFVQYFKPVIKFRADTDFATENLSGIYQLQWSLPAGSSGAISEPDYLNKIEAFGNWLKEQPGVVHTQTLTDTFRRLNKNMHGDDDAWYRLPDNRELAAQYLLLFEMSLPYGLDLNNQINVDKSAMRVIATTDNITTNELRALDDRAAAWLETSLGAATNASGPVMMFSYITKRNMESMLIGTTLALVLISFSLTIALRDIRLGLISLVPNLVPAIIAFGIWSILVGTVDVASSIVTATSLGIIVDATVHFLSKYTRARREKGLHAEDAVRYAFSTVGTALLVTAAILIAGFAVLALSAFRLNESMGLLTAIAIAAALVADFLLLPPLLIALDRRRTLKQENFANVQTLARQTAE